MLTWILTSVLLMLNLCLWIGNICNGLLLGNASITRGLTCCKKLARHEASRKSWSTKFPLGGGGKPYLASGLFVCLEKIVLINFFIYSRNEPPHDKTNKMICAPNEDSDQPGHLPSLIRVFAVRVKEAWVLSYPLSAQRRLWSDWADAQADLSLRWANSHFVGFVMSRLISVFLTTDQRCSSDTDV